MDQIWYKSKTFLIETTYSFQYFENIIVLNVQLVWIGWRLFGVDYIFVVIQKTELYIINNMELWPNSNKTEII